MSVLDRPSASTDALVLRAWPCGETSAVVSLLTRDHGFVKVIAKAARQPRSRLRALVEPGRLVSVEFSLDPRRELQYLRGGGVEFDPLGGTPTLERSAYLLGALELLDRCRPLGASSRETEPEATADLFAVCGEFLRMLDSADCRQPAVVFFAFEWELLKRHGLAPVTDHCCGCGDPAMTTATSVWRFNPAEGGLICPACARNLADAGQVCSDAARAAFEKLSAAGLAAVTDIGLTSQLRREIGAHLHRFLGYHLPGYRLPAALDLLRAGKDRAR